MARGGGGGGRDWRGWGWKGILTLRQDARERCIDEVVWVLDRLDVRSH